MILTAHQSLVIEKIKHFLNNPTAQIFILRGYAGTGKTTLIKTMLTLLQAEDYACHLMAPTGRAARILSTKTGVEATTIHKGIYELEALDSNNSEDKADLKIKWKFPIKQYLAHRSVVIVDEASMVSAKKHEQELFQFGTDVLLDDLLTFARPHEGGKLILVGDPAQLPPVGENVSQALTSDYFLQRSLTVTEADLTEVLRQGSESIILKNAMMLRDVLQSQQRNHLVFEEKPGEVEVLPSQSLLTLYLSERTKEGSPSSVVLCFSNKVASLYNQEIRRALYGGEVPLQIGDVLQVVQNNYSLGRMNGEFIPILDIKGRAQRVVPIWMEQGGRRERTTLTFNFVNVVTLNGDNQPCSAFLIEDLLTSSHASLSTNESRALYIDFCIRHPELKQGTQAFHDALRKDVYFNAIRAKYGYAVTGHKSQGGEWAKVFVDFTGRTGLSDDCLRWAYTVTTRAQRTLYLANVVAITPFSAFSIEPIQKCSKIDAECRIIGPVESTPFHDEEAANYLKSKYHCIVANMIDTPYSVCGVESKPYQEIYLVQTSGGVVRFDLRYKAGGIFNPATTAATGEEVARICWILDDESNMPVHFDYAPSTDVFKLLYRVVRSACDGCNVPISNVVEHPEDYSVVYYFKTHHSFAYLKIYVNSKGFVTYAKPMSLQGTQDAQLQAVVDEIKKQMI